MNRRLLGAAGATAVSAAIVRAVGRRAADRLVTAPRVGPDEAELGPALDALGGTDSATTATIRGRGAASAARVCAGSASAAANDPSPRIATASIAAMPPIDVPNIATRSMPRSPSQASAPAMSSTSSMPNVVGASADPP